MKLYKIFIPCLMALGLVSCACDIRIENVEGLTAKVAEKTRVTGDKFDLDDISAVLDYGTSEKEVAFKDFSSKNLTAVCVYPNGEHSSILSKDFVLEYEGLYEIQVNYKPKSYYLFDQSSSDFFDVEKKLVPATGLDVSETSICISKGSTETLNYTITPENSTSIVSFSSNDVYVATVNGQGEILAVEEGQCIITAEVDGFKKECLVTVTPAQTVDYVFSDKYFKADSGDWTYSVDGDSFDSRQSRGVAISTQTEITSPIEFADISNISFECSSGSGFGNSNSVLGAIEAYVDDVKVGGGNITAYSSSFKGDLNVESKSGTVKLVIKPELVKIYLKSISITCSSNNIYPTAISVSTETILGINETRKAYISYTPAVANRRVIEWSSSNEDVLTVGLDGTVHGVSAGTAIVTAKAKTETGYVEDSISVEVRKIDVSSIYLDEDVIEVYETKSKTIIYNIQPINASYKDVVFTSSNPAIATVDATGNVTGMSVGECVVYVDSVDNNYVSTSCTIRVLEKPVLSSTTLNYNCADYTENNYYSIDSAPSLGTTKLLVIPVWFTDSGNYVKNKNNVKEDIQKVYFGTEAETGWHSVKSYYEQESGGKLSITGTVSDWYECGNSFSKYNYDSGDASDATTTCVKNAVNWYFNKYTSDSRKNYDCDGDGFLDGVILIYGCPDYSAFEANASGFSRTSYGDNLWAYTYWVQTGRTQSVSNPGVAAYFWVSYDFMYSSGSFAKNRAGTTYGSGQTEHQNVDSHTFIHEMGHIFGLEDYYDYSGKYVPAGGFSMQDYNVGGHDPFSCLALGWAEAYIPLDECEITLKPFQSSHQVILLSPSFNEDNSPFDEYILVELYTPTGLNKFDCDYSYGANSPRGPSATGLRVWHVDARLVKINSRGTASPSTTYTKPVSDCKFMMSNTYYSTSTTDYISPCGKSYADFNLLQLIRNSTSTTYKDINKLRESYLFKSGSTFSMEKYSKQFVNSGKLNSGKTLGLKFSVSISGTNESAVATITITKD